MKMTSSIVPFKWVDHLFSKDLTRDDGDFPKWDLSYNRILDLDIVKMMITVISKTKSDGSIENHLILSSTQYEILKEKTYTFDYCSPVSALASEGHFICGKIMGEIYLNKGMDKELVDKMRKESSANVDEFLERMHQSKDHIDVKDIIYNGPEKNENDDPYTYVWNAYSESSHNIDNDKWGMF